MAETNTLLHKAIKNTPRKASVPTKPPKKVDKVFKYTVSSSPKVFYAVSSLVFSSFHQTRLSKELVSSKNISEKQF